MKFIKEVATVEIYQLPASGTVVLIQGGLVLLGVALIAKFAIKRFLSRKRGD